MENLTDTRTAVEPQELTRPVAPEDIRAGDYLVVLKCVYQLLYCPDGDPSWQPPRVVSIELLPFCTELPGKVLEVSLPLIYVKTAAGEREIVDVRTHRFGRVSDRFGRAVFKREKKKREKDATALGKPGV